MAFHKCCASYHVYSESLRHYAFTSLRVFANRVVNQTLSARSNGLSFASLSFVGTVPLSTWDSQFVGSDDVGFHLISLRRRINTEWRASDCVSPYCAIQKEMVGVQCTYNPESGDSGVISVIVLRYHRSVLV